MDFQLDCLLFLFQSPDQQPRETAAVAVSRQRQQHDGRSQSVCAASGPHGSSAFPGD